MHSVRQLLPVSKKAPAGVPKASERKKVVILGSGWASFYTIQNLAPAALQQYDITVISPSNHFVYTPMLPSVTVGTLEPRSVVEPMRSLIQKVQKVPEASISFNEAQATSIDPECKKVMCKKNGADEFWVPYDVLVLGVGATTNTFGTPGAMEHCHFLKSISDAERIRNSVMDCFETATLALKSGASEVEIDRLLSFVIVGAGPTGVEVAAELRDFISEDMLKHYPQFKDREINVQIVEMGNRALSTYNEACSMYTAKRFKLDDIELLTQHQVKKVNKTSIEVMDLTKKEAKTLPYGMCVWASGVKPNDISLELAKHFGTRMLETDRSLRVKGSEGTIFALGDCAKISVPTMRANAKELFEKADENNDGMLAEDEFVSVMENAQSAYPHMADFLGAVSKKTLQTMYRMNVSKGKVGGITPDMFEAALMEIDKEIKTLPPTAQVAGQQGTYLGQVLSEVPFEQLGHPEGYNPQFQYNHQGSMAYVGKHRAVIESPVLGVWKGIVTGLAWKGAYWAKSVSLRCKGMMALDWGRTHLVGRDISRI
jgi:NADH:ubiquinone reductase (non-electrogenic)